jgi:hypothetical protein
MPSLYLPADHTDADLVVAGQLAERLESTELYVTWTPSSGQAAAEVVAELRHPVSGWAATLRVLLRAVAELWVAFAGRRPAGLPAPGPDSSPDAQTSRPHPAAGETAA